MYTLGTISKRELSTVNSILQELVTDAIKITKQDFGIVRLGGKRTAAEQNNLYLHKVSKCDGYKNKSYHQSGDAVDLIPYIDGAYTWENKEAFNTIHKAVMDTWSTMCVSEYTLRWGGDWTYYDPAHYELRQA
jgi:peptidoglycan L-alanyl-D-glutamate endopeptidase CwlK